jgi:hypothetical protein
LCCLLLLCCVRSCRALLLPLFRRSFCSCALVCSSSLLLPLPLDGPSLCSVLFPFLLALLLLVFLLFCCSVPCCCVQSCRGCSSLALLCLLVSPSSCLLCALVLLSFS